MIPGIQSLYLVRAVVDMRKSYDGLVAMVAGQLGRDPTNGEAFLFVGRDRRRCKILLWHGGGFWIFMKRLARGTFTLPQSHLDRQSREVVTLSAVEWAALLEGLIMTVRKQCGGIVSNMSFSIISR